MQHVMIDLETMGLSPNAAIVSIGAVHFDEISVLGSFHVAVSLKSCADLGLVIDQSTVDWWMKQSAEARSSWQREDASTLPDALIQFNRWLEGFGTKRTVRPWGNGADFDLVLLKSAYSVLIADPPWEYYNHRCFRTVKSLFPVAATPRRGTHHNALDDAAYQAEHLQSICKVYKFQLR